MQAKSKHTLDSDEEDEEKYDRLDMKKVGEMITTMDVIEGLE